MQALFSTTRRVLFGLASLLAVASLCAAQNSHEVWMIDQSNSPGKTFGGILYIYRGEELYGQAAAKATPEVIDLGGAAATACMAATGANPVRPHMLFFNAAETHAIIAFVFSGHVLILDAATRTPVACLRATLAPNGARHAHAAIPSPDETYILVANQNGKLLERINTNYASNTFVLDGSAMLNLANCVTPNGVPCEAAGLRPNNAPICPVIDASGDLSFVTLAGGGLLVVNPRTTPMSIVGEYTMATVHGNGCGGIQVRDTMYINSGAGTLTGNPGELDLYAFPVSGYSPFNPPEFPFPAVVFADDTDGRDSHGVVAMKHGRFVWVGDRGLDVIEVFATNTDMHANTIPLRGLLSDNPSPDLFDISPDGSRVYMSMRGPNPLSGSPHVSTGSTPGLGVIRVEQAGLHGVFQAIHRVTNIDGAGVERADPHAIRVRRVLRRP
jgi:DNA-binding beta-propeller fold protein YncE